MTVNFRAMKLEDIDTIVAIEQEAFSEPWTKEAFINELTNNMFAKYVIVECAGQIAGYGGMWIIVDEAHVTNIAIASAFRGKGMGSLLMERLQASATYFGAARMTLEVRVSNLAAQSLYKKYGFEEAGVRPGYYSDNQEDALIMWAELNSKQQRNEEKGNEYNESIGINTGD